MMPRKKGMKVSKKVCEDCGKKYAYEEQHKKSCKGKTKTESIETENGSDEKLDESMGNDKVKKVDIEIDSKTDDKKLNLSESFDKFVDKKYPNLSKKISGNIDKKALKQLVNVKPLFKGITKLVNKLTNTSKTDDELKVSDSDYEILSAQFRYIMKIKDVHTAFLWNLMAIYGSHIMTHIGKTVKNIMSWKGKFKEYAGKFQTKLKEKWADMKKGKETKKDD